MRISTKGSYALEAMIAIALTDSLHAVSIREISVRTRISDKYLEQIFSLLKKKKLLVGIRGAGGGYRLARDAAKITAGDIIRAAEISISPVVCVNDPKSCPRSEACVTRVVWSRLDNTISETLDHISLLQLKDAFVSERENISDYFSI